MVKRLTDTQRQTRAEMREGKRVSKLHKTKKFRSRRSQRPEPPLSLDQIATLGHMVLPVGASVGDIPDPAVKLPRQHRRQLAVIKAIQNPKYSRLMQVANALQALLDEFCRVIEEDI
jgi:hypothetical protein